MSADPQYPLLYLYRTILDTYKVVIQSELSENAKIKTALAKSSTTLRRWARDTEERSSQPHLLILLSQFYDPLLSFKSEDQDTENQGTENQNTEDQNTANERTGIIVREGTHPPISLPPFDSETFLEALRRCSETKSKIAAMMTFYLHHDLFGLFFILRALDLGKWCKVGKTSCDVLVAAEALLEHVDRLDRYSDVLDVLLRGAGCGGGDGSGDGSGDAGGYGGGDAQS